MYADVQDKDGFLTADDLHTALGRSEDVKQLIAAADANGDGELWFCVAGK